MGILAELAISMYIAFSIINVWAARKQERKLFFISKLMLMPALIAVYLVNSSAPAILVVLALCFAWSGDVVLLSAAESRSKGQNQDAWHSLFIAGLAFCLCHLFYTGTFFMLISSFYEVNIYAAIMLVYLILAKLLYEAFISNLRGFDKLMKIEAGIYLLFILMMSFSSTLIIKPHDLNSFLPLSGSLLFILSDCLLAVGCNTSSILYQPWVMSSYLTAQFLIIMGLVHLGT